MKKEYWNVSDEEFIDKTGKKSIEWIKILDQINADKQKTNEIVTFLLAEYNVNRYWARTITTYFIKSKGK